MKKIRISILIVLFCLTIIYQGFAQAICPIETLKVNSLNGKVIWNDKTEAPIAKTKVDLIKLDEEQNLLSSIFTDEDGFFEFKELEKGKYAIDVWLYVDEKPYFVYRVALKVKKSSATKSNSQIQVKLGLDCWNSEANIVKTTATSE